MSTVFILVVAQAIILTISMLSVVMLIVMALIEVLNLIVTCCISLASPPYSFSIGVVSNDSVGDFFIADALNIDDILSVGKLRNSPTLLCSAGIFETSLLTSASCVGVVSSSKSAPFKMSSWAKPVDVLWTLLFAYLRII